MPKTSMVKRIQKWKPFTGKPAGWPKSRWDDARKDLKKMKLVNTCRTALNGWLFSRRPRLFQSCSVVEGGEKKKKNKKKNKKKKKNKNKNKKNVTCI